MWRVKHEERNQRVKCEEKWKEHGEGKRMRGKREKEDVLEEEG